MYVAQNLIFITSYYIYSNYNDLDKSDILLEVMFIVFYAKILHHSFIPPVYRKKFKSVSLLN